MGLVVNMVVRSRLEISSIQTLFTSCVWRVQRHLQQKSHYLPLWQVKVKFLIKVSQMSQQHNWSHLLTYKRIFCNKMSRLVITTWLVQPIRVRQIGGSFLAFNFVPDRLNVESNSIPSKSLTVMIRYGYESNLKYRGRLHCSQMHSKWTTTSFRWFPDFALWNKVNLERMRYLIIIITIKKTLWSVSIQVTD